MNLRECSFREGYNIWLSIKILYKNINPNILLMIKPSVKFNKISGLRSLRVGYSKVTKNKTVEKT